MRKVPKWAQRGIFAVLAVLLLVGVNAYYRVTNSKPKCPDDFATFEESSSAFSLWVDQYLNSHTNASVSDMVAARKQYYIDNKCTAALRRFDTQSFDAQ